ncbi:hypothetical protein KAW18_13855 [candidate division WOR-3 bacterium]|nr:hypothetical protein [candidate division WOR-3 bacterium]
MKSKKFDSVKMMREIREKITKEISQLSVREKISLLKKELPEGWEKRKLTSKIHNK